MTSSRDQFLARVRQAVVAGNRAGGAPPLPERGNVGYQGAGPDPVQRLRDELTAAGGVFHLVADPQAAIATIATLLRERQAREVLVGDGPLLDLLDLERHLDEVQVIPVRTLEAGRDREVFFRADVGITAVDQVIAETGTIVQTTRPNQPRAVSLLVPVHIAVARRSQLLPDLFDLFTATDLPACLSLITGPSKTGDIELRLVTGVHGPGEVHLILLDESASS